MGGFDYRERVAVVTGASSGIGRQIAIDMAERGVRVSMIARREEKLRQTLEEVKKSSPESRPESRMTVGSVGDRATAERLIQETLAAYGRIDFLINNAAIPVRIHITRVRPEDVEEGFRINVFGVAYLTLAVLPSMLQRREGWIVNIGSSGARIAIPRESVYSATKFALRGWTEGLWHDLHRRGVHVGLVNPGPIDTEIFSKMNEPSPITRGEVKVFPPSVVSDGVFRVIEKRKIETAAPRRFGFANWLHGWMPGLVRRGADRYDPDRPEA